MISETRYVLIVFHISTLLHCKQRHQN